MKNFSEATALCRKHGTILPVDMSDKNVETIQRTLHRNKLRSAWLSLQWRNSGVWKYITGVEFEDNIFREESDKSCGSLRRRGIYATECLENIDGYICERASCTGCNDKRCITNEDGAKFCLTLNCSVVNWFQAMDACKNMNGTLTTQNTHLLTPFLENTECMEEAWIGLTSSKWQFTIPGEVPKEPITFRWNTAPDGECAVINARGQWEAVHCRRKYAVLCFEYLMEGKSPVLTTTKSTNKVVPGSVHENAKNSHDPIQVLYISLPTVLCLAMFIFLGGYIFFTRRRLPQRSSSMDFDARSIGHMYDSLNDIQYFAGRVDHTYLEPRKQDEPPVVIIPRVFPKVHTSENEPSTTNDKYGERKAEPEEALKTKPDTT